MFNFGDSVDHDAVDKVERAGDSQLSTNRRQIGNKFSTLSPICCRFVDCQLCRQCVPGFTWQIKQNLRLIAPTILNFK